jgi:hypothetical protein
MSIEPLFSNIKEGGYFNLNFNNEFTNKEQLEELGLIVESDKLINNDDAEKQRIIKKRLLEYFKPSIL